MTVAAAEFLALQSAVAGRFSLSHEIGRGGMGVVFLAHDVLLERPVAIKMLAPHLAARAEMRRRFLREARIAAQCFHPHIVPIHSVEEADDVAYFVMAHVRGETLAERLQRVGPLPADDIRRIAREVGWALAYAHERGVIHRDVKPENILLEDGTSRALIADFGIAVHDDASRTPASGEVAGTARFMAPEQALGEPIDGRADLYALGVTLHVAATGRFPFDGSSMVALLAQKAAHDAPSVRVHARALPASLADGIDRCLARRADDRFPTAAAFVAAMEPAPIEAPVDPALAGVRDGADSAVALTGWSAIFAMSTAVLMLGESSLIGSSIIGTLGVGASLVTLTAAGMRGAETALLARRGIREGLAPSDVQQAMAGTSGRASNTDSQPTAARRTRGAVLALAGGAMGYAQGVLSSNAYGDPLGGFLQVAFLVLPPFLIGRGLAGALRATPVSRWVQSRVRAPLAHLATRIAGGLAATAVDASKARRAVAGSGRTEIMLEEAAERLFARLPASVQQSLHGVPGAAAALAREADGLRARDAELAAAERMARTREAGANGPSLESIAVERQRVQSRLATAITALETIRMDLLRLDVPDGSGLTAPLAIVQELQRRVDAEADVRALLAERRREPTPA